MISLSKEEISQLLAGLDSIVRTHKDALAAADAVLPLAKKLMVAMNDPATEGNAAGAPAAAAE